MPDEVCVDVIVIPKFLGSDDIRSLEQKLLDLQENVKIIGLLNILSGVYDPRTKQTIDGTYVLLNGIIHRNKVMPIKEHLESQYPGSYICVAFIERFEPQTIVPVPEIGPNQKYLRR